MAAKAKAIKAEALLELSAADLVCKLREAGWSRTQITVATGGINQAAISRFESLQRTANEKDWRKLALLCLKEGLL